MNLIEINYFSNEKGSTTPYLPGNTADCKGINELVAFLIS